MSATATLDPLSLIAELGLNQPAVNDADVQFQIELGGALALRLGYCQQRLACIPREAVDDFRGVGHHFEVANLKPGERVLDLGSGSGMDAMIAATYVGDTGEVIGVDMTSYELRLASALKDKAGLEQVSFVRGRIDELPFADDSFDCVMGNGILSLINNRSRALAEASRVLKPGGRLVLSDVVTSTRPHAKSSQVLVWASSVGGAMHREDYQQAISDAGFTIIVVQRHPEYQFLPSSLGIADPEEVLSISLMATKH